MKKFLIIGNLNIITYKEIFPLIKDNKIWIGASPRSMNFIIPNDSIIKVNAVWYTNLNHTKRQQNLILFKTYYGNESYYLKYDNYNAINVDNSDDIPKDYYGEIGVPITFLDKLCPNQFEIIGLGNSDNNFNPNKIYINPKKVKKDGNIVSGSAINKVLILKEFNKPNKTYYTADNEDGYLTAPYARIIIKRKL